MGFRMSGLAARAGLDSTVSSHNAVIEIVKRLAEVSYDVSTRYGAVAVHVWSTAHMADTALMQCVMGSYPFFAFVGMIVC